VEEVTDETANEDDEIVTAKTTSVKPFVLTFDFNAVLKKPAENKPVKVAKTEPKSERKAPQILSILVSETGLVTVTFSKPMMYSKNYVMKFLKDIR
jgi:hypothetical protein